MGDVWGEFDRGGARSAKFEAIGATYSGEVLALSSKQDTTIEGLPKWWVPGGGTRAGKDSEGCDPVMVMLITLQTDRNEPEDEDDEDDGRRTIWARNNMLTAIKAAVRKGLGKRKPTDDAIIGGMMTVKHHALGDPQKGKARAKLFEAVFTPAAVSTLAGVKGPGEDIPF
jgi:hypothetical protein